MYRRLAGRVTEAEAILVLLDLFPEAKIEQCAPGTQEAVMTLAIRQHNARRPPTESLSACSTSTLKSDHGPSEN